MTDKTIYGSINREGLLKSITQNIIFGPLLRKYKGKGTEAKKNQVLKIVLRQDKKEDCKRFLEFAFCN